MSNGTSPKTIGLMACVFLLGGGGATYYQYNALQQAKAKFVELEATVPKQEDLERELSETSKKLTEYRDNLSHLEQEVQDVAYVPTFMKELEAVGKFYAIDVTGVRPVPKAMQLANTSGEGSLEVKPKDYEEIEIEVKGRGSFEDVKSFLDALKTFPKVVAVKTINLTPQKDLSGGSANKLEAVVNLVAYVFPFDPATQAKTEPAVVPPQPTAQEPQVSAVSSEPEAKQSVAPPVQIRRGHPEQVIAWNASPEIVAAHRAHPEQVIVARAQATEAKLEVVIARSHPEQQVAFPVSDSIVAKSYEVTEIVTQVGDIDTVAAHPIDNDIVAANHEAVRIHPEQIVSLTDGQQTFVRCHPEQVVAQTHASNGGAY